MAKMYGRIKGSSLNNRLRTDGKFRSNANIGVDIDVDAIAKIVYKQVMKTLKSSGQVASPKMNEDEQDAPNTSKGKSRKKYKLSSVSYSMIASQIVSSYVGIHRAEASGDRAEVAQQTYTSLKGLSILSISTFGGPMGKVLGVLLSRLDGLVGQHIKNQIQLEYDNSRLQYNLTKNDIGRFSTYTYDTEQNKWVARDVEKIQKNILNQTT